MVTLLLEQVTVESKDKSRDHTVQRTVFSVVSFYLLYYTPLAGVGLERAVRIAPHPYGMACLHDLGATDHAAACNIQQPMKSKMQLCCACTEAQHRQL